MLKKQSFKKLSIIVAITLSLGVASSLQTLDTCLFSKQITANAQQSGNFIEKIGNGVGEIDWTTGVIKVTGSGAPPDRGSVAQKRLMAERAAIADAYRQLAEIINGVRVDSETVVKDFVTESDVIKTQVSAFIKGAQKVGKRYLSDGSVEVDMVVKLYGDSGLTKILEPQKQKTTPPPPKVEPVPVSENYTGVIIDCRNLKLQPAMSPAILDKDGGEIYIGKLPIDPDKVINEGIVAYTSSMEQAKQSKRAGSNPLIIKAIKISGNFKSDVVIENKDAQTLLGANEKTKILDKANVVLLR